MAGAGKRKINAANRKSQRGSEESPLVKWILITTAGLFAGVFLLLPLVNVFAQAFAQGVHHYWKTVVDPDSLSAIKLTLLVSVISVPMNVVFGVAAAWCVAKFEFRGKSLLITLIDLPFSVSPVVAGLMFIVLFGMRGFFGPWLLEHDVKIIFAVPGIILATVFITFPFVARELIPVMQSTGSEQEQAALTLGASGWQTFWYVTLPSVKWGLLYGVILCNARAMGEFGAVSVVSGRIVGGTNTMPLRVEQLFYENIAASFAVASLLAVLALLTLGLKTFLEWKQEREYELAQHAPVEEVPPVRDGESAAP